MADKNGWGAVMKTRGGKQKLKPKHGRVTTKSKKRNTARGMVRGKRGPRVTGGR